MHPCFYVYIYFISSFPAKALLTLTYIFLSLEHSNYVQLAEITHTHTHPVLCDRCSSAYTTLNMGMKFFFPGPFARVGLFIPRV